MKFTIWGARGSVPSPLEPEEIEEKICQAIYGMPEVDTDDLDAVWAYVRQLPPLMRGTVGGNTSCVEVRAGGETFILDAGSGIRSLGLELMQGPCGQGKGILHLFVSHLHWDHIQGFPFFLPAYVPGNRLIIYGAHDVETALSDQQRLQYYPVPLSDMEAQIEFAKLEIGRSFSIGQVSINSIGHNHPGDAIGFRFEDRHSVLVYATDSEYKDLDDAGVQEHITFFRDADALIFDAMYGLRESWESKVDWGHSSAMIGVDLARKAGVKRLLLFHHEPTYSDLQLQGILSTAVDYQAQDPTRPTCEVLVAHEGLTLDLTPAGAIDWRITPGGEAAVLTVSSTFDERGVDNLTQQLARLAEQEAPTGSVIDLSQVERLTTASLKALVTSSQRGKQEPIVLAAPSPAVEQVIKLGGYRDYFAIYASVDDAVSAVQAREALNLPGQIFNQQYQIVQKMGQGPLGVVLRVNDRKQQRVAALRVLSPTFGVETIDHFAGQVHRLLDLGHPNIARVYSCDWSQDGKHVFIVEEFLTGPTLSERMTDRGDPIAIDEALDIALDLTLALEYAHSRGVVHGNLKPRDVFLTEAGIKLSGFGLGRLEEGRNLLQAPMIFLAVSHLAPEQILGQPLDARSDLYALGVILYQLFTGLLPFEGTDREVMQAHLDQAPTPPRDLNAHLSRPVEHLILKLSAKNPNDRYASAQQARRISTSLVFSTGDTVQPGRRSLVGREAQLKTLRASWDQARAGRGQLAFITGELGIGKTSLAQQAAAQSETPVLLVGHCQEQEGSRRAYHPFAEALQTYLATVPPEFFDDEARRLISYFARLVPGLRQAVPDLSAPPPLEPRQEQLRLTSSLTHFVKKATQARPWFLILEDLQWVDQSSVELLRYLGRHLPEMALFILGTYRDLELASDHPLRAALRDLSSDPTYRHLPLDRLNRADVAQMLGSIWHPAVPDSLIEMIYRHTEGNPLYVEEVARSLVDDGLITMQAGRWRFPEVETIRLPQSVYDAVEGRIQYLGPDTRDVLSRAAVLGQTFRFDDLVAMSGQSEWEVLEHLDLAMERDLVQEISGGDVVRFSHVEIHHVIYSDLGTLRRRRLHRLGGETLERRAQPEPERVAEELAHHFSQAGVLEKGVSYSVAAARQSQAAYANEAALRWYKHALTMLNQLGPADTSRFDLLRLPLYRDLGDVLTLVGRWGEARSAYQQALELAVAMGDASAQAQNQTALGKLLWKQGALDEAWQWLERAQVAFAKAGDQVGTGEVLQQKGTVAIQQGNYEEARALFEESLAIRRSLGHKAKVAHLLNNLGLVAKRQGDLELAHSLLEESLAIRRELGDKGGIAMSLTNLGSLITLEQEDDSNARDYLEEAITIQREVGDRLGLAIALNNLGNVFRDTGDYPTARSLYEESLAINGELEATSSVADLLADVGGLAALEGQPERALRLFGAAEAQRAASGSVPPPIERDKLQRLLAPAREALSADAAAAALSEGKALLLEEAIEYALQD